MHIYVVQTWFFIMTLTLRCSPNQREKGSEESPFASNYHWKSPQDIVPEEDQRVALWIQQPNKWKMNIRTKDLMQQSATKLKGLFCEWLISLTPTSELHKTEQMQC